MGYSLGPVVWLTGLSGAGKSSVAYELQRQLLSLRCAAAMVDGDDLRQGLCSDLGFSREDRAENVRRAAELSVVVAKTGLVCLTALISPYAADRAAARAVARRHAIAFIEVFVDSPLDVCERRDSKGLYRKARAGCIGHFTGLSDPYESPTSPDVHLRSDLFGPEACASQVLETLLPLFEIRTLSARTDPDGPPIS